MALIYKLDAHGGFTVGDTDTGATSYAYPTSPHATLARRLPDRVAADMAKAANVYDLTYCMTKYNAAHYHRTHWLRLLAIA